MFIVCMTKYRTQFCSKKTTADFMLLDWSNFRTKGITLIHCKHGINSCLSHFKILILAIVKNKNSLLDEVM